MSIVGNKTNSLIFDTCNDSLLSLLLNTALSVLERKPMSLCCSYLVRILNCWWWVPSDCGNASAFIKAKAEPVLCEAAHEESAR